MEQVSRDRFSCVRGAYTGTKDDRRNGWYIQDNESATVDRKGRGYDTKAKAEMELDQLVDELNAS